LGHGPDNWFLFTRSGRGGKNTFALTFHQLRLAMSSSYKSSSAASTLNQSIQPDTPGCLAWAPGEPLLALETLCKAAPIRLARREPMLTFYHLTDSHHTDTGTGRSLEIARQFDPGDGELGRAYRHWAPFTGATLVSAVRTMAECRVSPISGREVDLLLLGGDFVNNSQVNELNSFASIFQGKLSRPFKQTFSLHGKPFNYEPEAVHKKKRSVSDIVHRIMHPGERSGMSLYKAASLAMAGAQPLPFPAAFVLGNHDIKALGHISHTWLTSLWAMQPFKLLTRKLVDVQEIKAINDGLYSKHESERSAAMKEMVKLFWRRRKDLSIAWSGLDFSRRAVTMKKAWKALSPLLGDLPIERGGPAYYTVRPVPGVVLIMLDTTARAGAGEGQLEDEQFQWLKQELARAETQLELAIVVSHHPSFKLVDPTPDPTSAGPVHLSGDFIRLLARSKAVIAHIAGHTHENRIIRRRNPDNPAGGYWEICTCSMIEWPQQFRFLELFRNGDGTLSIATCMMNHGALPDSGRIVVPKGSRVLSEDLTVALASFARKLSYRDGLLGADSQSGNRAIGRRQDRNVELLIRDPYA